MDRKIAEQIVALVNGSIDQLIATLGPVEAAVSPEEFAAYKRGIAKVINAFDTESHRSRRARISGPEARRR